MVQYKGYVPVKKSNEEDFINAGFVELPKEITGMESAFLIKEFKVDLNHDLPQFLISQYNHPMFYETIEKANQLEIFKQSGVDFEDVYNEEKGTTIKQVVMSDVFIDMITSWRLEFQDGILVLTACNNIAFPYSYPNAELLDKYAGEIVKDLKKRKLIRKKNFEA